VGEGGAQPRKRAGALRGSPNLPRSFFKTAETPSEVAEEEGLRFFFRMRRASERGGERAPTRNARSPLAGSFFNGPRRRFPLPSCGAAAPLQLVNSPPLHPLRRRRDLARRDAATVERAAQDKKKRKLAAADCFQPVCFLFLLARFIRTR